MVNKWTDYKIGDKVLFQSNEFDGRTSFTGEITKKENDHLIAMCDGVSLWIDKDTEHMFKKL